MGLSCYKCDAPPDTVPLKPPDTNPIGYIQAFSKRGWDITGPMGRWPLCPACQEIRKKKPRNGHDVDVPESIPELCITDTSTHSDPFTHSDTVLLEETVTMTNQSATANVIPMSSMAPSVPEAPRAPLKLSEKTALAEAYLDENYLRGGYCYRPGASDSDGAQQCELPLEKFCEIREEGYGPLADFAGIRDQVEAALATVNKQLAEIEPVAKAIQDGLHAEAALPREVKEFIEREEAKGNAVIRELKARNERVIAKMEEAEETRIATLRSDCLKQMEAGMVTEKAQIRQCYSQIQVRLAAMKDQKAELEAIKAKLPAGF